MTASDLQRFLDERCPYAADGKCHNAQHGTFGHECGKPATWIGTSPTGWQSGFCDHCQRYGDERHGMTWEKRK